MVRDTRSLNNICPGCFGTLDRNGFCMKCRRKAVFTKTSLLPLSPGTLLKNKYFIGYPLGMGGFGITYLAWDMEACVKVAIKEFFPKGYTTRIHMRSDVTVLKKEHAGAFNHWLGAFVDEAKVLTSISHMHGVVKIFDFFQANNTAYIVMEFLEGISLRKYLTARGGRIPLKETLNIMRPVLESLLTLHQYGIIHKDISPDNIQMVQNRFIKLIDFGAASIYTLNIPKPFYVLKHGFSPPELYYTNVAQGPWSDIYEIGATIYNCLTGAVPPPSLNRIPNDILCAPSVLGVQIPKIQENVLLKAMSIKSENRYGNIGDFIQMMYGEFMPVINTVAFK